MQHHCRVLSALIVVLPLLGLDTAPQTTVDRQVRESVRQYHLAEFPVTDGIPIQWTGSVAGCDPGTINSAYREATVRRLNYYRVLCGLPPVGLDLAQSAKCQDMALMIDANDALSHNPPESWSCWTADGAEAASKSNLAWGVGGRGAIDLYMDDFGAGNEDVGHRRWILYPRLSQVGSGSTPSANCLWVVGNTTTRPAEPAWVAWPNEGYVPYQVLPSSRRWSLTLAGADFSAATVSVSEDGNPLAVSIIARNGGFGDKALVWRGNGLPTGNPGDGTRYDITIAGIANAAVESISYSVVVIDPAVASTSRAISVAVDPGSGVTATISDDDGPIASEPADSATFTGLDPALGHRITFSVADGPG